MQDAARTQAILRELRRLRPAGPPLRRQKVLPRPVGTQTIELGYYSALAPIADKLGSTFAPFSLKIMADLERLRAEEAAKGDGRRVVLYDARKSAAALKLVKSAATTFNATFPTSAVHDVASQFGQRMTRHQRLQFDKQIRAAVGVPYAAIERPIRQQVPGWVTENVGLIKTVGPRYFARIERDVMQAYQSGMHPSTLAEQWQSRKGMAQTDVMRIARDQINKLNGALNKARQESLGVSGYIWRCMRDNRVRECHAALDGVSCSWDDPPQGGGTDEEEEGHPGDGIQCRCYAEPDLSGLFGE